MVDEFHEQRAWGIKTVEPVSLSRLNDQQKRMVLDFPLYIFERGVRNGMAGDPGNMGSPEARQLLRTLSIDELQYFHRVRQLSDEGDYSDYSDDIRYYKSAMELAPWDPSFANSIGSSYWNAGKKKEALEHMEDAHRKYPDDDRIRSNLEGMRAQIG